MPDRRDVLSQLREALADLYDDQSSARRVADDVGLDAARIERADRAVNLWHGILREAERQGKMDALLAVAMKEYPARTDLAELRAAYLALSAPKQVPPAAPAAVPPAAPPSPRALWWVWPVVGLLVVVAVVVLASRGRTLNPPPTPTRAQAAAVTATPGPPASEDATAVPVVAERPSPAPTAVTPPDLAGCFGAYFSDMAPVRVTNLEPGTDNLILPAVDLKVSEPIGFLFTLNEEPIGAMRFRHFRANQFFRIESIVDAGCAPIEDYRNDTRGGDKNVLQMWDTLLLTLGGHAYGLRMGRLAPEEAPDNFLIQVSFAEPPS